jgi:asparagine synthase (glutamine-hydrolysing)
VPRFNPPEALSAKRFGDERPFVEDIAEAAGNIDPVFLDSSGISPLEGIREASRMCGRPFHGAANAYWLLDIYQTAMRDGYGTLLMGPFGNATISWPGMAENLPAAEIFRRHGAAILVKRKLLKPMLYGHTPAAYLYKRLKFGKQPWDIISYCTQPFQDSLNLRKRIRESGFDPTFKNYYRHPKDQLEHIVSVNVLRLIFGTEFGFETGLEFRDPTADPHMFEYAMTIPNEMYFGDMNKWVLRTMMKGRLPDSVRLNAKKGLQSADIVQRLYAHRAEMDAVLAEMEAAGFGRFVDLPKMRTQWKALQEDPGHFPHQNAGHMLRSIAAFELYRPKAAE